MKYERMEVRIRTLHIMKTMLGKLMNDPTFLRQHSLSGNNILRHFYLNYRLDIEAALAYTLPPVTSVALLILEVNNTYVRFHAWQSALLFSAMLVRASL